MPQYIEVNSNQRENLLFTWPSECTIPCHRVLDGWYGLKAISLPITYHNVNANNCMVYWSDSNSNAYSCQLEHGYYSSFTDLAQQLATAMTAVGPGSFTCSVNSRNNRLTVTSTVAFRFTFDTNKTNSAAQLLGFSLIGDTASATVQMGQKTMDLNSTSSYNITISNATTQIYSLNGGSCTFKIPATTSTPNYMYYEPSETFPITFNLSRTDRLSIRIMDDKNRVLNNMSSDFYMILVPLA